MIKKLDTVFMFIVIHVDMTESIKEASIFDIDNYLKWNAKMTIFTTSFGIIIPNR